MVYSSDSLSQALTGPIGRLSTITNPQGLGIQGYDKSIGQSICRPNTLTRFELRNIYRQHSIVQRVVNYTGDAGTRRWLEPLQIADDRDSDVPEELKSYWKRLHTRQKFKQRDRLARQFGGACIFIGAVDGTDTLEEPINVDNLQTISFLKAFDRWEIYPSPSELSQTNPEFYVWYPSVVGDRLLSEEEKRLQTGVKIHKSRILRQDGVDLPRIDMHENLGWGDSVIQAFIDSMLRYEQNMHQVAHMLASHDIFLQQINGLSEILSQQGGLDEVVNLAKENWRMLSMFRTMIQDGDRENSSYVSHSFGGVADSVKISMEDVTARIGLPHHVIWGSVGKAGLADSGGAEKQAENDMVSAYQQDKWLLDLEYLAELTFAADDFEGEEPDDWELLFKHLHEPTEMDKATIKELYSRIDSTNIQSGIMTGLEARERQTSTEFITDLVLPDEPPEELQPDDPLAGLGLTEETEIEQPQTELPTATEENTALTDSQDFVDLVERFDAQLRQREEEVSESILAQMDAIGRKYSRIIRDNYLEWGQRDLLLPAQQQELVDEIKGLFRFDFELRDEFLRQVSELYRVADQNGEDMAIAFLTGLNQPAERTEGMTEEELQAITLQSSDDLQIQGERFAETAAHTVANLIALGASAEETSRQVRNKLNRSAGDVTTAVEGHSVGAESSGSNRVTTANGLELVQLFTEGDNRVCPFCAARAYNVYRIGEIQVPIHPNCVTGETFVAPGGSINRHFKRRYKGTIIRLTVSDGNQLSITPNHPVLTPSGWVLAGSLAKGDRVISAPFSERGADNQQVFTRIKDVPTAFGKSSQMSAAPVPMTSKDFHNDGTNGEIASITPNLELLDEVNIALSKHFSKNKFMLADRNMVGGNSSCHRCGNMLIGGSASLPRILSGFNLQGSLPSSHSVPLDTFSLTLSSTADSSRSQSFADGKPRNTESFTERVNRFSRNESFSNNVPVTLSFSDFSSSKFNPEIDQSSSDSVHAYAVPSSNTLNRLTGKISTLDIIDINIDPFDGHVYNIETEDSIYAANGIVVHNCRCQLLPYRDEFLNQGLSASFFAEDRQRQINELGKQPNYGVSPSERFRGMENPPTPVRRFTQTGDELEPIPNTRETAQLVLDIIKGSFADRIRSLTELTIQYDPDTDQLVANGVFVGDLGPFDFTIDTGLEENKQIQYQLQNADEARSEQTQDSISIITDAKKCTKGFSCGNSCQAIGRACLVGLTADQKKQVNALKGAARATLSQELQQQRTTEPATEQISKKIASLDDLVEIENNTFLLGEGGFAQVRSTQDTKSVFKIPVGMGDEEFIEEFNAGFVSLDEKPDILETLNQIDVGPKTLSILTNERGKTVALEMENINMRTLDNLRRRNQTDKFDVDGIISQLQTLHKEGIVHSDLHDENIAIRPNGKAVLLDFGLAERVNLGSDSGASLIGGDIQYLANTLKGDSSLVQSPRAQQFIELSDRIAAAKNQSETNNIVREWLDV